MKKLLVIVVVVVFMTYMIGCTGKGEISKQVENNIKDIYCGYHNNNSSYINLKSSEVNIKFYLGKYGNAHCAIIEGDMPQVGVLDTYVIKTSDGEFIFKYMPEIISVYYQGNYYHIKDAYAKGILTSENINSLYNYCNNNLY